jgi:uncharacterized protein (DUF1015 family)
MARLYPFRALRYDPARVNMEAVVTQPYDKITPAMQQRYYEASPYNLVRIILGKHEPGDDDQNNVYTRAAHYLHDWRKEHVLAEESEPAVYGYSQTYTVPGTSEVRERRGFIALGHLYDYADKVVYRHEQTFPKHKSDRLALFKATRAYCEQIYMLYSDPAFTAEKLIFQGSFPNGFDDNPADLAITDEYGVIHRLWRLTDPHLINLLLTAMADKKLIIADGHHRYETSVAYAKERSAQLKLPFNQAVPGDEDGSPSVIADGDTRSTLSTPPFPEAAMMMTFVNMDAPGITILPTHRVVTGIENFSSPDFITKASAFYNITELTASSASDLIAQLNQSPGDSFIAATGDGNYLLTPKPEAIGPFLKDLPPRQRQLGVAQLHTVVLDHLLGLTEDKIRATGNIQYLREASESVALVESGQANVAFLIKPITLDQLKDVSLSGEVMPQKSTDFYPKLLSGLAIYALD